MKREFVILIKFSKVSMTKMIKNMVTVFFRRREAKKACKSCSGPEFQHGGKGVPPCHQAIFRHQLVVLQFNSVLTLSTQRELFHR